MADAAPDDADKDPRLGQVLQGRYRIVERLASGGMGVVYRGERLGLGRAVAIKFVWAWAAQDEQVRKRFEREAQAMSRLTHPSCVGVIDFGIEEGSPFLVMDFARGKTLRAALDEGPLSIAQALYVAREILGGLAHAHEQGITHRDIKPDNVVLSETSGFDTHVRILDFGLAKLKDVSSNLSTGFALGTPRYMSPEQTFAGEVDARSDLYAVGVVLFEMLTGTTPFAAEQYVELLRMHREVPAPTLAERAPGQSFSPALEAAVARALKKAPEARFGSAAEFAAALAATPEATTAAPVAPQPRVERRTAVGKKVTPVEMAPTLTSSPALAPPPPPPRSRLLPVAVLGVLLAAGAGAFVLRAPRRAPAPTQGTPAPTAVPPAAAPAPAPARKEPGSARPSPPGLAEARAMVKAGRSAAALDALRKLRAGYPDNAEVPYLMGRVYFDKLWWSDGFEAYHAAIARDPAYRQDKELTSDVLKSLVSDRYGGVGVRFIEREVGAAAIPYVEELTDSKSQNVRARAIRLLARLRQAR